MRNGLLEKREPWVALLCVAVMLSGCTAKRKPLIVDEYPKIELTNDRVRMAIYLPDEEKGYYLGVRFDWSGMIVRASYRGHTFFGPGISRYDPDVNAGVGTAEEFVAKNRTSYDEAKPGDPFVKIGVGVLERGDASEYGSLKKYRLLRPGKWEIARGGDWVSFHQDLTAPRGWAYSYTKRISLTRDRAGFTIRHRLRNTGTKTIETWHYNHNFVILDDDETYPDYRVKLPFAAPEPQTIKDGETGSREMGVFRGNEIVLTCDPGQEWVFAANLNGLRNTIADNDVLFENRKTGAVLRVRGDVPAERMAFFATKQVVSVEPYVEIKLAPGQQKDWTIEYTFIVDGSEGE